jgi:hypothetical protein
MHLYASTHKVHSVDTLHSDALAFLRIQTHSRCGAVYMSCILMHLYASTHKVHSVARCILTHSHSYTFKRIQMHSLTHAVRESADLPRGWLSSKTRACIRMHSYAFVCIRMHSYAFVCIRTHSYAFVRIRMHSHA